MTLRPSRDGRAGPRPRRRLGAAPLRAMWPPNAGREALAGANQTGVYCKGEVQQWLLN